MGRKNKSKKISPHEPKTHNTKFTNSKIEKKSPGFEKQFSENKKKALKQNIQASPKIFSPQTEKNKGKNTANDNFAISPNKIDGQPLSKNARRRLKKMKAKEKEGALPNFIPLTSPTKTNIVNGKQSKTASKNSSSNLVRSPTKVPTDKVYNLSLGLQASDEESESSEENGDFISNDSSDNIDTELKNKNIHKSIQTDYTLSRDGRKVHDKASQTDLTIAQTDITFITGSPGNKIKITGRSDKFVEGFSNDSAPVMKGKSSDDNEKSEESDSEEADETASEKDDETASEEDEETDDDDDQAEDEEEENEAMTVKDLLDDEAEEGEEPLDDEEESSGEDNEDDENPPTKKMKFSQGGEKFEQSKRNEEENKVFVNNLPPNATEEELRQALSKVGTITSVVIPRSKEYPDECRGFAFVTLQDKEAHQKTVELDGVAQIGDNQLNIRNYTQTAKGGEGGRGGRGRGRGFQRGGRGFGGGGGFGGRGRGGEGGFRGRGGGEGGFRGRGRGGGFRGRGGEGGRGGRGRGGGSPNFRGGFRGRQDRGRGGFRGRGGPRE